MPWPEKAKIWLEIWRIESWERWNPSEVNPLPSQGRWTKKTHFGTDFSHNTFPNRPKKIRQEILSPSCLDIFEHNKAGVWSIWTPPVLTPKKTFAKWTNLLQIIRTGENWVWSIRANFLPWKVNQLQIWFDDKSDQLFFEVFSHQTLTYFSSCLSHISKKNSSYGWIQILKIVKDKLKHQIRAWPPWHDLLPQARVILNQKIFLIKKFRITWKLSVK